MSETMRDPKLLIAGRDCAVTTAFVPQMPDGRDVTARMNEMQYRVDPAARLVALELIFEVPRDDYARYEDAILNAGSAAMQQIEQAVPGASTLKSFVYEPDRTPSDA